MLCARDECGSLVFAFNANKKLRYFCPTCHQYVVLKQGTQKVSHFAHQKLSACANNLSESSKHYEAKYSIAQALQEMGVNVEVEKRIAAVNQIPDVIVNERLVIEIQFSPISIKELRKRTRGLEQCEYRVFWLVARPKQDNNRIKLSTSQSACIHPSTRTLFAWDHYNHCIVLYEAIQHIGGRWYTAKWRRLEIAMLLDYYKPSRQPPLYKLSHQMIATYLKYCRKQCSVYEPTLSLAYRLRMQDEAIASYCGWVLSEQLYISAHPIYWQLLLISMWERDEFDFQYFKQRVKPRDFIYPLHDIDLRLKKLIEGYKRIYTRLKLNNVQKMR